MPLSQTTKKSLINSLIGKGSVSFNTVYVGLCTEVCTDTTIGTEVPFGPSTQTDTSGYHRIEIDDFMSAAQIEESTNNVISVNQKPVMFYRAKQEGGWGTIKSVIFMTSATGGSATSGFIGYSNLETPIVINKDDVANFDVGELKLTLIDNK